MRRGKRNENTSGHNRQENKIFYISQVVYNIPTYYSTEIRNTRLQTTTLLSHQQHNEARSQNCGKQLATSGIVCPLVPLEGLS